MSGLCYICGEDNPNVLQTHHILPRRYGGGDGPDNLVRLCANCHQAVESLYDERFFDRLISEVEDWPLSGEGVESAVSAFVEDELEITREGDIAIRDRAEVFQDYVEYCELRQYAAHTSPARFFESLEEVAPEGVTEVV
mgnify:FL=1